MNRRDIILFLAASGAPLHPALGAYGAGQALSGAQGEALLRLIAQVEPRPGEGAAVVAALQSMRFRAESDPRVQPALGFNPEIDV